MSFEEELVLKTEEADEIVQRYLPKEEGLQKTILSAANYSVRSGGKRTLITGAMRNSTAS